MRPRLKLKYNYFSHRNSAESISKILFRRHWTCWKIFTAAI